MMMTWVNFVDHVNGFDVKMFRPMTLELFYQAFCFFVLRNKNLDMLLIGTNQQYETWSFTNFDLEDISSVWENLEGRLLSCNLQIKYGINFKIDREWKQGFNISKTTWKCMKMKLLVNGDIFLVALLGWWYSLQMCRCGGHSYMSTILRILTSVLK